MSPEKVLLTPAYVRGKIYKLDNGEEVMLDFDLADVYGTSVGNLNRIAKDRRAGALNGLVFQLTPNEWNRIERLCQAGRASIKSRNISKLPYAYTERACYKVASFVKSDKAGEVLDVILDAFFLLRKIIKEESNFVTRSEHQTEMSSMKQRISDIEVRLPALSSKHITHASTNYYAPVTQVSGNGNLVQTVNQNELEELRKVLFDLHANSSVAANDDLKKVVEAAITACHDKEQAKPLSIAKEVWDNVKRISEAYELAHTVKPLFLSASSALVAYLKCRNIIP